jgi:RNA polymerase sigma factor (sigma-70 family)
MSLKRWLSSGAVTKRPSRNAGSLDHKTRAFCPMARDENLKSLVQDLPGLSVREQQITQLACAGLSNKAIAHQLRLSEGTIKIHLHHIYRKLRINGRHALVALALSRRGRSS